VQASTGELSDPLGVSSPGVCAITGASGYVGSEIAAHLIAVGWEVRALCRSAPTLRGRGFTHVPFDLASGPTPEALEGADALVHAAYDFSHTRWSDIARVNVDGSRQLLRAARDAQVARIVCVSTVAAFPGTRSLYGRAKLEIEQTAIDLGASVIRCGLVWGPHGGAMFGALRRAVERLPVVPLPAPADLRLMLVCEDDLVVLLERLLDHWPDGSGKLFVAASEQALTWVELLRSLSPGAGTRFVPIPWRIAWLGLRSVEMLGITPPFRSDSLLSLIGSDDDPLARATARAAHYGVGFRAYSPA
jgi:nucleoside-diphosphate-sugar epimerase